MNRNSVHVYMFPWYQSRAQHLWRLKRNSQTTRLSKLHIWTLTRNRNTVRHAHLRRTTRNKHATRLSQHICEGYQRTINTTLTTTHLKANKEQKQSTSCTLVNGNKETNNTTLKTTHLKAKREQTHNRKLTSKHKKWNKKQTSDKTLVSNSPKQEFLYNCYALHTNTNNLLLVWKFV